MTDSFRKRDLIGNVFPRFSMIEGTDSPITMVTILIKIHIKSITYKKRSRPLRPIVACDGSRYFGWKSSPYILRTCHTQVFLRRIRVLILNYHNQIVPLWIFHNSSIDNAEIRIEKHGSLRERFEILSRYIIDTVVQSLFTFTGRHFLMTAGDRSCPEDIIGL